MALFEIQRDSFESIARTSFSEAKLRERGDLQRLLRSQIEVIDPGLYVIAEEFGNWQDSNRRIDLLAIDREANLVVIELKRTQDGGHMELQSIRYAAMISSLTFKTVVEAHAAYLTRVKKPADEAEARILRFLEWSEPLEEAFGSDVKIVLVSEDFSTEVTTTALWLRDRNIDIRCVRLRPYANGTQLLVDVQTIIPLPEVEDYMVKQKDKREESRSSSPGKRDRSKFRVTVDGQASASLPKNRAILTVVKALYAKGASPLAMRDTINQGIKRFYAVPGNVQTEEEFVRLAHDAQAENGGREFDPTRYFTIDEDLMSYQGKTYAFSNQWGQWTENKMRELISAYGDGVVTVAREESA